MPLPQLFGKERTVGIDIGSAFIKIMEVEPNQSGWKASKAGVYPTPPGTCRDGMITDPLAVGAAIRDAMRHSDIHSAGVIAAVSGSQVLVRNVQLPQMPEATLKKSIKFEAAKYITANVDESLVEFEILDTPADNNNMNVMLVAAPRDLVESRVQTIQAAGLEPLVVDVEAFALMRSLVEFSQDPTVQQETVALLDMGAAHTDLNIITSGRFALTRNIPIAGSSLTQAVKSLVGCDDAEAEALKKSVRIGPRLTTDDAPPDESLTKAARALQPLLDELMREIRRSLHYFQSLYPEGTPHAVVNRLLLTGGTSQMVGLPDFISARLSLRAQTVNIFTDDVLPSASMTEEDAQDEGASHAVSAGLSLNGKAPGRLVAPAAVEQLAA